MPTGAVGLNMGLMERGEGPDGHMGALGSMQGLGAPGLTHCISCGVWRDGEEEGGGMVSRGLQAAGDMEQGALALIESFLLHQH